jgi:nitrogenase iron protein NifH
MASEKTQLRLAVYGKGGIGKSTMASNLSAAFASMGKSVLQIGCDPKHDSTRLLLGGKKIETVLQFLENPFNQSGWFALRRHALDENVRTCDAVAAGRGLPQGLSAEKILHRGFGGVLCVEAGGPVPGVGCAGRGILSTFELLEKLNIGLEKFDVIIYDVLGDVVCGGFGVPLRDSHANRILIVTSEEYMPIYAANNIVRGVENYQRTTGPRLAGLFLNKRDNGASNVLVERFSAAAELPVLSVMPRSTLIQKAEKLEKTVIEAFPESDEARCFLALAERLSEPMELFAAKPLTDDSLESLILKRTSGKIGAVKGMVHPFCPQRGSGKTLRIAIYGKGGIGKSTVAANLSASLAAQGKRVLQIGCDPKHDSTRLLLGNSHCRNVLEALRENSDSIRLEEVLHRSPWGVDCVEVGGPVPGVGCAGRGILSAFSQLKKLGLSEDDYDVVIYDVLGDIVCGGFAIPLRKDYAQVVMIVTSEEFMPLYAANNILSGIRNVSGLANRVYGLFLNGRDNAASKVPVEAFARATGIPIVARMPRSPLVGDAENSCIPLNAAFPESEEAGVFADLARELCADPKLYEPWPLEDGDLEAVVLHGKEPEKRSQNVAAVGVPFQAASGLFNRPMDFGFTSVEAPQSDPFYYREKPIRPPVMECAFDGALMIALKIRDAYVVAHSPESCTHMRRTEVSGMSCQTFRKRKGFYPDPMVPNLVCTCMGEQELIYGGTEKLTETLCEVLEKKPPVVFLVTSCVPAIIGDNYTQAISVAQSVSPKTRIILLRSDGNMTGGGMNGMLSALFDGFFALGKPGPTLEQSVNLVMDWNYEDSREAEALLSRLGISINARFTDGFRDTTVAELEKFPRAPLTLLCGRNFLSDLIRKHLMETGHGAVARQYFPRGFQETELWLREIGAFFGIGERVDALLSEERPRYEERLKPYRKRLLGKRLVVFTRGQPVDDIVDTALDAGMEVPLIGVIATREESLFRSRHENVLEVRFGVRPDDRVSLMEHFRADAVFTVARHDLPVGKAVYLDTVGAFHGGFETGLHLMKRWNDLFLAPGKEGWKMDFSQLCPVGVPSFMSPQAGGRK